MLDIFVRIFRKIIVLFKLNKRFFCSVNSFCRKCGVDVQDFYVENNLWEKIRDYIPFKGNILCFNCFVEICHKNNLSLKIPEITLIHKHCLNMQTLATHYERVEKMDSSEAIEYLEVLQKEMDKLIEIQNS